MVVSGGVVHTGRLVINDCRQRPTELRASIERVAAQNAQVQGPRGPTARNTHAAVDQKVVQLALPLSAVCRSLAFFPSTVYFIRHHDPEVWSLLFLMQIYPFISVYYCSWAVRDPSAHSQESLYKPG